MVSPIRIFLLEDDLDLRSSLESLLELEGYEVVVAADYDGMLEALRSPLIHLPTWFERT